MSRQQDLTRHLCDEQLTLKRSLLLAKNVPLAHFLYAHSLLRFKSLNFIYTKRKASKTKLTDFLMVEVTGLEPAASWSQTKHSTKLSYTSINIIFKLFLDSFYIIAYHNNFVNTFMKIIYKNRANYFNLRLIRY